jgi:hypothetical protein
MTGSVLIKLLIGLLFLGAGIWQSRRRSGAENDSYGSQSGVILIVIGIIALIVALGGLEYHPSAAEIEAARGR